jgi:hypothetical protein
VIQPRSQEKHILKGLIVVAEVLRIQREQNDLRPVIEPESRTSIQEP